MRCGLCSPSAPLRQRSRGARLRRGGCRVAIAAAAIVAGAEMTEDSAATATQYGASARRRLRIYFLLAAAVPSVAGLLIAVLVRSSAALWLAACAAVGVMAALGVASLAVRRIVIPLHGIAEGLS